MFPRTRVIPLLGAAVLALGVPHLLAACGQPPQPLLSSPPYADPVSSSASAGVPAGPGPASGPPLPGGPPLTAALPSGLPPAAFPPATYPPATATAPGTRSPVPAPAGPCPGAPTGAEILALIKGRPSPGIPNKPLQVDQGPLCSGYWSFTTVRVAGVSASQQEPLLVVAVGSGSSLGLVAAGSDVCNDPVRTGAPPGVRVLACGY